MSRFRLSPWTCLALSALVAACTFGPSSSDSDDDDDGGSGWGDDGWGDDGGSGSGSDGGSGSGSGGDSGSGSGSSSGSDGDPDDGLGDPLTCDLEGRTYEMDAEGATWVQPAGVGSLLASQLGGPVMISVTDFGGGRLQGIGAIFEGGEQDFCTPTIEFPRADFDDPGFSVGPSTTSFDFSGFEIQVQDLRITGMFADDCSWVGRGTLEGELDARDLAPVMGELMGTEDPDEICDLMAGFGVECQACSSDGKPLCIPLEVEDITGVQTSDSVECVALEDCHPECWDSWCEDPADGEC